MVIISTSLLAIFALSLPSKVVHSTELSFVGTPSALFFTSSPVGSLLGTTILDASILSFILVSLNLLGGMVEVYLHDRCFVEHLVPDGRTHDDSDRQDQQQARKQ